MQQPSNRFMATEFGIALLSDPLIDAHFHFLVEANAGGWT